MLRPKRILYLMDYYYGTNGGTEGQVIRLVRNMDRSRFDPTLMVLRSTDFISNRMLDFPCPLKVLGIDKIASLTTLVKLLGFSIYLRKQKISIVHVFFNDASIIAPFFCWLGGAKAVVSRRDMGIWYNSSILRILPFVNLFVNKIVANSEAVAKHVVSCEKVSDAKLTVIYNGYELPQNLPVRDIRAELQLAATATLIGIVANLSKVKRHADLIQALSQINRSNKDVHLLIIGMGWLEDELREKARSFGLEKFVHYLGSVTNVIPIVRQLSVGVICSESEGFSNAIMEYMACGVPTVCTNVGGNPEIVKNNENGFLVEVGDVSALAASIDEIISNSETASRMSANAYETSLRFSCDKLIDNHITMYNRMLTGETK